MKSILLAIALAFVNSAMAKTTYVTLETPAGAGHSALACPEDLVSYLTSYNGAALKVVSVDIYSGGLISVRLDGSGPNHVTEVSIPSGSGCVLLR